MGAFAVVALKNVIRVLLLDPQWFSTVHTVPQRVWDVPRLFFIIHFT